jgi:RNA polymerase sigma factor (sigma-70 family)
LKEPFDSRSRRRTFSALAKWVELGSTSGVINATVKDQGTNHLKVDPVQPPYFDFNTTHWGLVLQAGAEPSDEAYAALEKLCQAYWRPLFTYVRRQGHSFEDAQDLTQDFFARLLEKNYLRLADRNRGSFRTFLIESLKRFLINERDRSNSGKRGDGLKPLLLSDGLVEEQSIDESMTEQPSDALFDRGWAAILIDRAMAALRAEIDHPRKRELFERLKVYVWGAKNTLSYALMAEQLGMTEDAVKVAVHRFRQRYGELLRAEVAQTVTTAVEAEQELRYLISVVRSELSNPCDFGTEKL